ATDILRLGERPIDPTAISGSNPTMFNENCTVCHSVMDPVAGAFQNFNEMGDYRPLAGTEAMFWYPDMREPGFGEAVLPGGSEATSEQWLAKQLTADPRFAQAAVAIIWKGLLGTSPLTEPFDAALPGYEADLKAFE